MGISNVGATTISYTTCVWNAHVYQNNAEQQWRTLTKKRIEYVNIAEYTTKWNDQKVLYKHSN